MEVVANLQKHVILDCSTTHTKQRNLCHLLCPYPTATWFLGAWMKALTATIAAANFVTFIRSHDSTP